MTRSGFLKGTVFLLLFAGFSAAAWSQVTISGGFALSYVNAEVEGIGFSGALEGNVGIGGNVYADYLLPIGIPLSLGIEIGVDGASIDDGAGNTLKVTAIPLLLRVAYHFDIHPQFDLYLVGKIGYAAGFAKSGGVSESDFGGLGFGVDLGVAFYFMPRFGLFAEGGFDLYNLAKDFTEDNDHYTIKLPFSRFLTVGISTKF